MTKQNHAMRLISKTDDSGIWLACSCGYREQLGHNPTIMTVLVVARSHHEHPEIASLRSLELPGTPAGPDRFHASYPEFDGCGASPTLTFGCGEE